MKLMCVRCHQLALAFYSYKSSIETSVKYIAAIWHRFLSCVSACMSLSQWVSAPQAHWPHPAWLTLEGHTRHQRSALPFARQPPAKLSLQELAKTSTAPGPPMLLRSLQPVQKQPQTPRQIPGRMENWRQLNRALDAVVGPYKRLPPTRAQETRRQREESLIVLSPVLRYTPSRWYPAPQKIKVHLRPEARVHKQIN